MPNRGLRIQLLFLQSGFLFGLIYYYIYLRVRPELFYWQTPQVFLFDSRFFYEMASRPGGLVAYAAAFLSPLCTWDWLGSLVIAVMVGLICWLTRGLLGTMTGKGGEFVYLLPGVAILMLAGQYVHPVELCVGLCVALAGARLYVRLGDRPLGFRLAGFAVAALSIYIAAAGLFSVFACLCAVYEWRVQRNRPLAATWALCAAVVPYAASWWPYDLLPHDAFRGLLLAKDKDWLGLPSSPTKAAVILSLAAALPVVLAVMTRRRRESEAEASSAATDAAPQADTVAKKRPFPAWTAPLAVPLAVLLLIVLADLLAFDSTKRFLLEVECASGQERWDDVLLWAKAIPLEDARAYDPQTIYCINRALFHKGQLLDRMFEYPQLLQTPTLTLIYADIDTTSRLTPRQCSEIFFDLGRINESEQMAFEVLEQNGNRPEVLKRLACIFILKGKPKLARQFLLVLNRSLLHREWARQMLSELDSADGFTEVEGVAQKRAMMVRSDSMGDANNTEKLLVGLLNASPHNKMAFDYLMAHYLLNRQLDAIAAKLDRFAEYGYAELPRHVREAVALRTVMRKGGKGTEDLTVRSVSPATWQRLSGFIEVERESHDDVQAAFAALYPDYHDTYFFAAVFGHNISSLGVMKGSE